MPGGLCRGFGLLCRGSVGLEEEAQELQRREDDDKGFVIMKINLRIVINCCLLMVTCALLIASTVIYVGSLTPPPTVLSISGETYKNIKDVNNFKKDFETKTSFPFSSIESMSSGYIETDSQGNINSLYLEGSYKKDENLAERIDVQKKEIDKDYEVMMYSYKPNWNIKTPTIETYLNAMVAFDMYWDDSEYRFYLGNFISYYLSKGNQLFDGSKFVEIQEDVKGFFYSISVYTNNASKDLYIEVLE